MADYRVIEWENSIAEKEDSLVSLERELFPAEYKLIPQMRQIYELNLAYAEYKALTGEELIRRGAYFQSIDGRLTNHFRICTVTPEQVSASAGQARKNFFAANIFAVGYATHGLFPYRGKFHPQMIKAIMNIIGLRKGDIVLDPMVGCGTTLIEATVIGVDSIGIELSPFACLMSRAKLGALQMDCTIFPDLLAESEKILDYFDKDMSYHKQHALSTGPIDIPALFEERPELRAILELCYLDTIGYARRRKSKSVKELFPQVLKRYLAAIKAFNAVRKELQMEPGASEVIQGDARRICLNDQSIDGIIFSPPYSFAVDYVENDRPQLEYMGFDVHSLKSKMVGLREPSTREAFSIRARVDLYFADMEQILRECSRVLKQGRYCVIVIGSNTRQTGGIILEEGIIQRAGKVNLTLKHQLVRDIEGIRNTMRQEHILFFEKS